MISRMCLKPFYWISHPHYIVSFHCKTPSKAHYLELLPLPICNCVGFPYFGHVFTLLVRAHKDNSVPPNRS